MKKTLLAILGALCSVTMMVGFASCDMGGTQTPPPATLTYTLDSKNFEKVVAYKSAVDYTDLKIQVSNGTTVNVTAAMISGNDTNSVGNKQLTVSYEGNSFKVDYTVKYQVEFIDGTSLGTQYVLSASEIEIPTGYDVDDWTPEIPTAITDNMTFNKADTSLPSGSMTLTIGGEASMYVDGVALLPVTVSPSDVSVKYEVTSSNDNVVAQYNYGVMLNSKKIGVSEITVKAINKEDPNDFAVAKKTIVIAPVSNPTIVQAADTYGIEKMLTLGGVDANGNNSAYQLGVSLGNADKIGAGYSENMTWVSSNPALASINNSGVITRGSVNGADVVSFTAKFVVGGVEYASSQPYAIRFVSEGVNVTNYEELYAATKAEKAVVLKNDIDFPTSVADIKYETIHTTYDDGFYVNKGAKDDAVVKILLQFKNDLYGNGYVVNAHNATAGLLDATGAPTASSLFTGPLNFVAMGEGSSLMSVKAQDNICFALYEGVTVNNAELRGCNLRADDNGNYDLTDLDYIGTTVEVLGDNVNVEYSRITNGRTVMRIFGDAEDATKAIHVNIQNSVLSGAREFIIRMGSNCFVQGTDGNYSPYIGTDDSTKKAYNAKTSYASMTAEEKAAHDAQYIKTFVNVKNSVFKDAGIFAIGMDSHFSGSALHQGHSVLGSSSQYWKNLAKTSYGAKLTFEGVVRMYNWKLIDEIDSSTLIENKLPETGAGSEWRDLTFDVKEMVAAIAENPNFSNIITQMDGKDYVHAGIAFFGGGKNYSVFENSATSQTLVNYTVDLTDVGQGMLKTAAGQEPFYFTLCDKTTVDFTPAIQKTLLASDSAYDCIYAK